MKKVYDIAAYVWPSYHPDPRAKIFWPDGIGEWQTVMSNKPKFPGHEQPRFPLWGYVNEADPHVMQMQIDAAADHGVNVFIYDWYWYDGLPFLEGCLNDGYLKAKNKDRMKFYLMWANHDATMLWDKRNTGKKDDDTVIWKGGIDRQEFEIAVHRIIDRYFSQPQYFKLNGKPCFMLFELGNLIKGLGGLKQAVEALKWFRKETVKAGFKGLELQLTLWGKSSNPVLISGKNIGTQKEIIEKLRFDSVTNYQIVQMTDVDRDYLEIMKAVSAEWENFSKEFKIPYYPHVSIGWDNNPRFEMFRPGIVKNNTPANFEKALKLAKSYADARPAQAPLVTVNSWNEWTETSYLEPCTMYGYGYLEAVKKVFTGN